MAAKKPVRKTAKRTAKRPAKGTRMPKPGQAAPDFTLQDTHGNAVRLSGLRGTPIVLYFYPKDDTPGCTLEAQEFTKHYNRFLERGAIVFGISRDTRQSHCAFVEKYGLEVPLLADPTAAVIKKYGCWIEKNLYGKKQMGTQRATFVIDREGNIQHVFPKVDPKGHALAVLKKL